MAATEQAGGQESEIIGVPQGEGVGQQAETSDVKKEKPQDTPGDAPGPNKQGRGHAGSKNISLVTQAPVKDYPADSAGMVIGPGVENGAFLDSSAHQQNLDESSFQQADSTQQLSDEPSDVLPGTPRRVGLGESEEANQEQTPTPKKRRGRRSKAEILAATVRQLTSTPQMQQENPEVQEMTLSGRPKRRAAKVAMEYLHSLVEDMEGPPQSSERKKDKPSPDHGSGQPEKKTEGKGKGKRGRKRKARAQDSSDPSGDEDFVPDRIADSDEGDSDEEHDADDASVSSFEKELKRSCRTPRAKAHHHSIKPKYPGKAANGLINNIMGPIWCCASATKQFREEHSASWVFPEWIPSAKDWLFLSEREAEKYMPNEKQSPAFRVSREGLKEDSGLCRIKRFECLPFHSERWDMAFFVGGPVWSMEWCPCPDGGTNSQFAAIYCNKGMDDRHKMSGTHSEPALLQIWDLGELQYDTGHSLSSPLAPAQLAYAIAVDDGCIWDMKWCPSGAWELPTTSRKAPHMARLGLLAACFTNGKIAVYSLPHRDALAAVKKSQTKGRVSQPPLICQVRSVAVLKVGSIQAGDSTKTGQCFCLDWLPIKPHNIVAAGFYDGSVALWNLNTKSLLQRVRSSDGLVTLASSDLMVTASDDRKLKFWDLRKTYEPVSIHRRCLTTEICWPLLWSGICVAQECCYATYGQHGIHYLDAGYFGYKAYFIAPRKGTIWSTSFSDWMNTSVTADSTGEMIMILLPDLSTNPANYKRNVDRRFPVYRAEMVQFPGSEREGECNGQVQEPQLYNEVTKKYYLHFHDMDLRTFKNAAQRAPVKRMQATETTGAMSLDKMPLDSLYKVRLNPNLCAQSWVLSAGQSGLVRAHCLRAMNSPVIDKMVRESEAQFSAMFLPQGATSNQSATMAVRHSTESTVQVVV
ncbi:hypothetical protein AAFF_G00253900 [Aldrovandia affinis]|uniref:General transcription factor 3C polypeptide 2 n=1 Tax=Aldrovandia affinis TaxID=143900 RepID=A0AAD7RFD4_9TELE|nr:hypothetical protein AAFF_G00253900 [Aldrovandia affinis]